MPTPANKNNRLLLRRSGNTLGPIRLTGSTVSFTADIHDISILGIGLIGSAAYDIGSVFGIESGPKGRKLFDPLTAEVRHVTQVEDGRWLLGCSLSRSLTSDDVDILG